MWRIDYPLLVQSYQDYDLKCWRLSFLFISPSICRVDTIHSHRPFSNPLRSLVSLPEPCSTLNPALTWPNEQIALSSQQRPREAERSFDRPTWRLSVLIKKGLPGDHGLVWVLSCKYPVRWRQKCGILQRLGALGLKVSFSFALPGWQIRVLYASSGQEVVVRGQFVDDIGFGENSIIVTIDICRGPRMNVNTHSIIQ